MPRTVEAIEIADDMMSMAIEDFVSAGGGKIASAFRVLEHLRAECLDRAKTSSDHQEWKALADAIALAERAGA